MKNPPSWQIVRISSGRKRRCVQRAVIPGVAADFIIGLGNLKVKYKKGEMHKNY
jgi:hypothetical protein